MNLSHQHALHFTYEKYPTAAAAACCLRWLGRAVEFSPCNRVVHSVSATRAETSSHNRPRTLLEADCAPAGVSGDAGNLGRRNPLKLVPGPPPRRQDKHTHASPGVEFTPCN